tara:strand:- start:338 stop:514 length:177 start_codon:yes stop_codon:yes gene_type:complete
MNDSKTYTISEDLYKAILERVYVQGATNYTLMDDAVKEAIKTIEYQQYIYEDRLTEEG